MKNWETDFEISCIVEFINMRDKTPDYDKLFVKKCVNCVATGAKTWIFCPKSLSALLLNAFAPTKLLATKTEQKEVATVQERTIKIWILDKKGSNWKL